MSTERSALAATPANLLIWAREGNVQAALDGVSELVDLTREERLALREQIRKTSAPPRSVFCPLGGPKALTTSVRVVARTRFEFERDALAIASIEGALRDAWKHMDGHGPPPHAEVELGLAEAGRLEVTGQSMYLAVYLAALSHYRGEPLLANVLATGAPSCPIGDLSEKHALFLKVKKQLGWVSSLWVATSGALPVEGLDGVLHISPESAGRAAFRHEPWPPDANVLRLHVCPRDKQGTPWPAGTANVRSLPLNEYLGPRDALRAAVRVGRLLQGVPHCELSVAGPGVLAAALGVVTRNGGLSSVRFINANDARVWWHNKATPHPKPPAPPRPEARVLVGPISSHAAAEWEHFVTDLTVTEDRMPEMCADFLQRYAGAETLHVAFASLLPLAWALAGLLKNNGHRIFYQSRALIPWFETRDGKLFELGATQPVRFDDVDDELPLT